jgi:lipid-binding SYLF domain-containing protein
MRIRASVFTLIAGITFVTAVLAAAREEGRLLTASEALEELRSGRDQVIPDRLLERAYGIAVIPDLTKVAFFAGGRRGHGALVVRDKQGRFTDPVFVTLTGGSFGWQWGVQSADIVLVFTTPKGVEGISGGKVTLGADASVAAGPVGRQASAATDASFKAEVYSYSRSRGLFAGVALDGSALTIDNNADARFYDKGVVNAYDIIGGNVRTSSDIAKRFLDTVGRSTGSGEQAPPAAAPISTAPPVAAPAPSTGAQTFPMPDPKPGQEPPAH